MDLKPDCQNGSAPIFPSGHHWYFSKEKSHWPMWYFLKSWKRLTWNLTNSISFCCKCFLVVKKLKWLKITRRVFIFQENIMTLHMLLYLSSDWPHRSCEAWWEVTILCMLYESNNAEFQHFSPYAYSVCSFIWMNKIPSWTSGLHTGRNQLQEELKFAPPMQILCFPETGLSCRRGPIAL